MPRVLPDYKVQAKARIAQAGFAIFAKKGFRNTTMEDIAKAVGVSKGDLYLYFRNKADLLREIQSSGQREMRQRLNQISRGQDWIGVFLSLIDEALAGSGGPGAWASWFDMMALGVSDPRIGEVLRADYREDQRIIRDLLRRVLEPAKKRTAGDLDELAMVCSTLLYGAIAQVAFGVPWPKARRMLRRALESILLS